MPVSEQESERPPELARMQRALAACIEDLERKLADEVTPAEPARNSVEQFVSDVVEEARGAGSRLLRAFRGPRALAVRLATALAVPQGDSSGVDARLRDAVADALRPIARGWLGLRLRVEIPLPQRGAILIALNRSGWPLPTEAMIVAGTIAERARRRDVYVLWDAAVAATPALGLLMRRVGVLAAEPGAAGALLDRGALVIAFPEGGAARAKSYAGRYRLAPFDDGFVIDEARKANAAIVPAAIVGHEESFPVLGHLAGVPLTPTFPFTGALGLLPLPLRWRVHIGAPVHYEDQGGNGEDTAKAVRARMQAMLGEMVSERRSIVRG